MTLEDSDTPEEDSDTLEEDSDTLVEDSDTSEKEPDTPEERSGFSECMKSAIRSSRPLIFSLVLQH